MIRIFMLPNEMHWPTIVGACAALFLLPYSSSLGAQLSSQGFSGLINVPSAFITDEGHLEIQYNDQVDSRSHRSIRTADNYLFSVGMAKRLEFGGRLINQGPAGFSSQTFTFGFPGSQDRDLSAQAKLQIFSHDTWPSVAIGIQDVGGNAKFQSEYLVLGQRHRWLDYSLGYGRGRLDGLFYGAAVNLGEHAQLLFDDDSNQTSYGIRVDTGNWFSKLKMNAYWRYSADGPQNDSFFGVGIDVPLGGWAQASSAGSTRGRATKAAQRAALQPSNRVRPVQRNKPDEKACTREVTARLEAQALERVAVSRWGEGGARLVVRYEGRAYPRSDVDALGVVFGEVVAACAAQPPTEVLISALHNGQAKYWVAAQFDELLAWFNEDDNSLAPQAGFGFGKPPAGLPLLSAQSRKTWVEVAVDPVINYVVGSEFGVFDYSAGLETNVRIPLWSGAEMTARRRDHVENSDDYELGQRFFRSNIQTGWDSYLFQQLLRPHPKLLMAGYYGRSEILGFGAETYGGELALSPLDSGKLQLYSKYINYNKGEQIFDNLNISRRDSWTGTLRYFSPKAKAAVDLTWGQFVFEDEGMRVTLRRYFGDTHVGLVYKATKEFRSEAVGFSFSLPLTPSRSRNLGPLQFQGSPNWTTFIQTLINRDTNFLSPDLIVEILPGNNIQTDYFDRGRLSAAYINASWARMREAHRRLKSDSD